MARAGALDRSWPKGVLYGTMDYLLFKREPEFSTVKGLGASLESLYLSGSSGGTWTPVACSKQGVKSHYQSETPHRSTATSPTLEMVPHSSNTYWKLLAYLGGCFGFETESY